MTDVSSAASPIAYPKTILHTPLHVGRSESRVIPLDEHRGVFRRQVKYNRFPSQKVFDELDVKFKGFSGPVGSGKSAALVRECIKLAYLNPGVEGLLGSPTYRMLMDTTLIEMIGALEAHKIPYRFKGGDMTLTLTEPNSTILLRTMDNPERLRGMNLGWFGVDELTYCREESWQRLQGRLRNPKARIKRGFGVWTPKGRDWVWRMFISAKKVKNFHCVQAKPFENRAVLDVTPDYYENLKLQYDEKFYRQEVLGEYLDMFGGAVYHAFNGDRNVKTGLEFDPNLPLIWCMDFNINPMTSVLAQCYEAHGRKTVHVLREFALPDSHVIEACKEFVRRTQDWVRNLDRPLEVQVYGDATGGNPNAASQGESCWSLVEKFMSRQRDYRCDFRYPRSNPTVVDRINAMNMMLCSFGDGHKDAGQRSLFIDESCGELILDFEDVSWKVDAAGITYPEIDKAKNPKRTHLSDALGYYIYQEHSMAARHQGAITTGLIF